MRLHKFSFRFLLLDVSLDSPFIRRCGERNINPAVHSTPTFRNSSKMASGHVHVRVLGCCCCLLYTLIIFCISDVATLCACVKTGLNQDKWPIFKFSLEPRQWQTSRLHGVFRALYILPLSTDYDRYSAAPVTATRDTVTGVVIRIIWRQLSNVGGLCFVFTHSLIAFIYLYVSPECTFETLLYQV